MSNLENLEGSIVLLAEELKEKTQNIVSVSL